MRGLRSTIALLVVLVGLGAYIYFVTWKTPADDRPRSRKRCSPSLDSDKIEEIKVTSATGETHDAEEGRRQLADRRTARREGRRIGSVGHRQRRSVRLEIIA